MSVLRLILADQLNYNHSWFNKIDSNVVYCIFEMRQETNYVKHHIQKVVGFFLAMRAFKNHLECLGHSVIYYRISDSRNSHNLSENIIQLISDLKITQFEYQLPDEYRLDRQLIELSEQIPIPTIVYDSEHFYSTREELAEFFKGKKQRVMESFYRYMRLKHGVLVTEEKPIGGKWNYDNSNRNKWKEDTLIPIHYSKPRIVDKLIKELQVLDIATFGQIHSNTFEYPINRIEALEQLKYFNSNLLKHFGDYQDAMHSREVNLYHSRISFALNIKFLAPKEVVDSVVQTYHTTDIDLNQAEGFIRQIIGWREYMRGMYWAEMPEFKVSNYFNHKGALPDFFWTGNTKMNCLKQALSNSLDNAYAHHIQRLMVIGNFSLLAQVHPDLVDNWFLGVYIDAIEWVQITNTRGMSQFADGGKIATKPYISSGSYIDKMSNYCSNCTYNKKTQVDEDSCPFNSLYWNFLIQNKELLKNNFRMRMMYSVLHKMTDVKKAGLINKAQQILSRINEF